ncbi:MAG: bifunctional DNA-formamidopyrimidine glycosylase/DNA-(apurinic or apyrimidinic site) lyase [Hydrocarboniphaga sp.]|uniref:bifunctional DNA-formamidopyrimidine glycosylase/DNA-(apurinic or apyrimidinic site) lyase n=1 Tax=Hydrocarboniphaga sp. TaxID=2033016 RepID=UPI002615C9DB|nr:bifunctional DNA-formamidopyrimidine glycosylase/DNA-(apurinic or apyrimidinic site) lyase [Hydrocarboniphaga sp.]MDB5968308.1 bifunctional DNA-formamidopyrimidine glycosylase/DNA-(apurinic or apyrimidinic site) lyase [Hydrocarboniphaga sp.]
MPELPEVETIRRGVEPYVVDRRISRVLVREARMRWPVPPDFAEQLRGRLIVGTSRRGKYLLLHLDNGDRVLIHLGMSGRLLVLDQGHPLIKHDHVDIELGDGKMLRFHDPRRFGAVLLWRHADASHPLLAGMGPEPFSDEFDGDYLHRMSRGRSAAIKSFVMDGRIVVGAGNIYAAESLFRAGIRPTRAAGDVSLPRYRVLASMIRDVLNEAIMQGGTTLRDFAGADGAAGYFQQDLYVYGRDTQPCRSCATPIRRLVIGQRSSFFCPRCQR